MNSFFHFTDAKHVPPPTINNVILDRQTKLKQELKVMVTDLYNNLQKTN